MKSRLEVSQQGDVAVVRFGICPVLDESVAQSVGQELVDLVEKVGCRKLLLNMEDVTFLTSTALGKFVVLYKRLKIARGDLKICGLRDSIETIFVITRLNALFEIHPDQAAALQAFAKK